MNKILIIASVASMIDQFNMPNIKLLQDLGYKVDVACNFEKGSTYTAEKVSKLKQKLSEINVKFFHIDFSRSPFSKQTFIAYQQLKKLIDKNSFDIIHCHTPVGGLLTRLAARKARKKGAKIIYTAHGFHFFKGAPILNWLLYYPTEKICSYFTDVLITINKEDFDLAKRKMKAKKIYYIPGVGIDSSKFSNTAIDKTEKRKSLGLTNDNIVLLSVGELNKNKNHHVIIQALSLLNNKNIHYVIAGKGSYENRLKNLAKELGLQDQVHLLGYRTDISELCKISDIFCFPSLREGLGLAAIEAMATGLPIITSNIHGINDYSKDGTTGYKCNPRVPKQFVAVIEKLVNSKQDRIRFGEYNKQFVKQYDVSNVDKVMRKIYSEVLYG